MSCRTLLTPGIFTGTDWRSVTCKQRKARWPKQVLLCTGVHPFKNTSAHGCLICLGIPFRQRLAGCIRLGLRHSLYQQDPRALRPGTSACGNLPLRPLRPILPSGAGPAGRQTRLRPAQATAQAGQLRLPAPGRLGMPPPSQPGVRGPLHPHRRTIRTGSLGITSNLVFSEWERIFSNPRPPPRRLTG